MKFETLKSFNKNKVIIPIVIISCLVIVITIFVSHSRYVYKDSITIINDEVNYKPYDFKTMAIYQQKETCTDTSSNDCYEEKNIMPSKGYTINEDKSYCYIDDENNKITGKVYTNEDGEVVIKELSKRSKCYLYFDYYGTEENPIIINSINDLVELSTSVNSGDTYEGMYIKLEKDLDFQKDEDYEDVSIKDAQISGSGFIPIGNLTNPFKGNFDGNNHKINNLYINDATSKGKNLGFFGNVSNASIKNLEVSGSLTSLNWNDVGGIVGYSVGNSTFSNLVNRVNVTKGEDTGYTGGIAGGLGEGETVLKNCINYGTISNGGWIGGLIGGVNTADVKINIEQSANHGVILKEVGEGLVGMGGIIGAVAITTKDITIKDSYNDGNITDTMISDRSTKIGGIIGGTNTNVTLENVYNKGDVTLNHDQFNTAKETYLGGLIGSGANNKDIKISNSYNTGKILNGSNSGGLIGIAYKINLTIEKSHNSGIVKTSNQNLVDMRMGGLIGYSRASNITILDSYNENLISAISGYRSYYVSGIVGIHDYGCNVNIINTYNIGNIESGDQVNGIIYIYSNPYEGKYTNLKINNCYNLGKITGSNANPIAYVAPNTVSDIQNAYYDNSYQSTIGTSMAASEMQKMDFALTLNNNLKNINLNGIIEDYTLSSWTIKDNYVRHNYSAT